MVAHDESASSSLEKGMHCGVMDYHRGVGIDTCFLCGKRLNQSVSNEIYQGCERAEP